VIRLPSIKAKSSIFAGSDLGPHCITPQLLHNRNQLILLCDGDQEHRTLAAPNIGARHRVVGNGVGLEYIHGGDNVGFLRLDQSAERRA